MNDCLASASEHSHGAVAEADAPPRRVRVFGVKIDPLYMTDAIDRLLMWARDCDRRCRYVVTPNADHVVLVQEHEGLQQAYADADLVLVDGMPVLLAAKLLRRGIPERVAGSDLVPALFSAASLRFSAKSETVSTEALRIYLLGAAPGVAERAAANIERRWSGVHVVGCHSPGIGFEKRPEENAAILSRVAAAEPDVLIVGLGAPKQELWVHAHRDRIAAPVALCVGATIDFLAGERKRAPRWMRRIGLEWLHRMASEPRRLATRYCRDAVRLPGLVLREWAAGRE
jgi:N-acetylglucosaminyldiphosphoundecaprenol N-acetyl-beta-D-mannosaminyltransferase